MGAFFTTLCVLSATLGPLSVDPFYARQFQGANPSFESAILKLETLLVNFEDSVATEWEGERGDLLQLGGLCLEADFLAKMLREPGNVGERMKERNGAGFSWNRKIPFWVCAAEGCWKVDNLKACSRASLSRLD